MMTMMMIIIIIIIIMHNRFNGHFHVWPSNVSNESYED